MVSKGSGKYVYKPGTRVPYEWKPCQNCGEVSLITVKGKFCSMSCRSAGKNNSRWKGDDATYISKHFRVYSARGKPGPCIFGQGHGRSQWANLTGDYGDPDDYAPMCASCHGRYDKARLSMEPGFVKHARGGKSPAPTQMAGYVPARTAHG
jgi:hypothetical protein